jgi:hypothetical protein
LLHGHPRPDAAPDVELPVILAVTMTFIVGARVRPLTLVLHVL